jgi:hypothetical protein
MTATEEKPPAPASEDSLANNRLAMEMIANANSVRTGFISQLFDPRRDLNAECGYPNEPTLEQYNDLYEREGIAKRVVNLYPEESWRIDPIIQEDESTELTEFESSWIRLQETLNIYHFMQRIDTISGIGRFGILLIGFNDGADLAEPVPGVTESGEYTGAGSGLEINFLRPFDETAVRVQSREQDEMNPRFGMPTSYTVSFQDQNSDNAQAAAQVSGTSSAGIQPISGTNPGEDGLTVHWTRVIHIADNRRTSEVFGTPRMKPVLNRILDIRKILSGSGEMFWKGAFPGYSFEMTPEAASSGATLDTESVRKEFEAYSNGLQRYLATTGLTAKSLAPQMADPRSHVETEMRYIAITIGIPFRIFQGSEQSQLASTQDKDTWNERVGTRQNKYVTPMILRPFIDRLVGLGVLPTPADGYHIIWPDLATPSDLDKAEVAAKRTDALVKYVMGSVTSVVPVPNFLEMILGLTREEVDAIVAEKGEAELAAVEEIITEETQMGLRAVPPRETQEAELDQEQ